MLLVIACFETMFKKSSTTHCTMDLINLQTRRDVTVYSLAGFTNSHDWFIIKNLFPCIV